MQLEAATIALEQPQISKHRQSATSSRLYQQAAAYLINKPSLLAADFHVFSFNTPSVTAPCISEYLHHLGSIPQHSRPRPFRSAFATFRVEGRMTMN
jgi:hypothetical protein